jgi:hypothetical protein
LNLRDVLNGILPLTGPLSSNRSDPLSPEVAFPSCGTLTQDVPLPAVNAAHLSAWHKGLASPQTGNCAGSPTSSAGLAVGYVTVDVVNRCSTMNPSSAGYFAAGGTGVASNDNALLGDVFWVNAGEDFSQGDVAVHLEANAETFGTGSYTFYGRFVDETGIDARQPLGRKYGARYLNGGGFDAGTRLLVWRDPKVASSTPLTCGSEPTWSPLAEESLVVTDEAGKVTLAVGGESHFPLVTQVVEVGAEIPIVAPFGKLEVDLAHAGDLFGEEAQGWLGSVSSASGRYSVGLQGQVLQSICPLLD